MHLYDISTSKKRDIVKLVSLLRLLAVFWQLKSCLYGKYTVVRDTYIKNTVMLLRNAVHNL